MTLFNFQALAPVLLLVWLPPEKQQFANEGEGDEKEKRNYKYYSCKQCRLELQCVMREKMSSGQKDTKEKKK